MTNPDKQCFSLSEFSYDAAKGCMAGMAVDAVAAMIAPAIALPSLPISCALGATYTITESLIDSAKCAFNSLPDSNSYPISNGESLRNPYLYPSLDEIQYGSD